MATTSQIKNIIRNLKRRLARADAALERSGGTAAADRGDKKAKRAFRWYMEVSDMLYKTERCLD